jgi:hypothetical protein
MSGITWASNLNELPAMEGTIVNKLKVDNDGYISNSGTEVSKIYGTNGVDTVVAYAQSSAISGAVSGLTYAPTGLNALYRIQGLDWTDSVSYDSSLRISNDATNPYASAQKEALAIFERNDNVHAVEVGYKEVNGVLTETMSVKFFVTEKKPLNQLAINEILPSEIKGIVTDVVEQPIGQAHGTTLNESTDGDLLNGNRVGIGSSGGTLGIPMINVDTGELVSSSCAHVATTGTLPSDGTNGFTGSENVSSFVGTRQWFNNGDSSLRGVCGTTGIFKTTIQYHDCDLSTLSITDKDKCTPFIRVGNALGQAVIDVGPVEWALPGEVTVGMKIFRRGRYNTDTGTEDQSDNNNYHIGTVTSLGTRQLSYGTGADPTFGESITARARTAAGDSGCPWFALINGRVKYIGNHIGGVAGTETTGWAYILPAWKHYSNQQNIRVKAWNGDLVMSKRTTPTLNMFGRVYEFIGYTKMPITHTNAIIDP